MRLRRTITGAAVAATLAVGGVIAAGPASAYTSLGTCNEVKSNTGQMCLFYNSNYGGSNSGFYADSYYGAWAFTSGGTQSWNDNFRSSGAGQNTPMWHNMGSDSNYSLLTRSMIRGDGGADWYVYPNTSNNLGGDQYNEDTQLYVDF